MASSRASNVSEFRQVLSRLKDLHEKLERSDQSSLAAKLSDINDSLSIIEGNQTDFSDTVLQTLERIHSTMQNQNFLGYSFSIKPWFPGLTSEIFKFSDAVSQNFASNKRKRRQMENGTYEQYQREQKRRQRIKRSELFKALHLSMISSDESDGEDDTLSTKHLVWRAEEVSSFFKELDSRHRANMSTQQRRQCVNRQVGLPSTRSHNEVPEKLLWAIKL
ncbi:unnamed protein product [Pocillopora meandrina]|uniref:Uncharacterized protein n=1 Tax=Pocillopora meandrina TaxID=46732 RepID=A0AAU9XNG9_9CNID|nr:unnamed protein product [Pocillopora meandrina]